MAKAMSKESQIAALRETNGQLEADVVSLSNAIGELEAEIVTERATAARLVAEATERKLEALHFSAGDAGDALKAEIEALKKAVWNAEFQRDQAKEALGWAEKSRDEMEAEMEKVGAHWREKAEEWEGKHDEAVAEHKVELDNLREELERENEKEIEALEQSKGEETENLRAALDGYLADLGYPRDPHPSTISCPHLRRLVTEIN